MKLEVKREKLLRPLQQVAGVVERRQTLPILTNVLFTVQEEELTCTATDLEVELSARMALAEQTVSEGGATTLPARKLLDILRALPEDATVTLATEGERANLRCGRSRFSLATLPVDHFQTLQDLPFEGSVRLSQRELRTLIEQTHFAMAQQDVRYYLNGLLLEINGSALNAVATDGHRLALYALNVESEPDGLSQQVIVPRKGVQELLRLLSDADADVVLKLGPNHIQAVLGEVRFTSKLIDGKFPDYQRVIPRQGDRLIVVPRDALHAALKRAAILSSEKQKGVRLQAENGLLRIQAHNPEQEEAEEELETEYAGDPLEIGFNVAYLLDAISVLSTASAQLSFTDANSSCLIQEPGGGRGKHVVMPMRL